MQMQASHLHKLKKIFEESDVDGEPGLDLDEFRDAIRRLLGQSLTEK